MYRVAQANLTILCYSNSQISLSKPVYHTNCQNNQCHMVQKAAFLSHHHHSGPPGKARYYSKPFKDCLFNFLFLGREMFTGSLPIYFKREELISKSTESCQLMQINHVPFPKSKNRFHVFEFHQYLMTIS